MAKTTVNNGMYTQKKKFPIFDEKVFECKKLRPSSVNV